MTQQVLATEMAPRQDGWKSHLSLNNRFVPPLFISLILLIGHLEFGILESYQRTVLAIATCIIADIVLGRILIGKLPYLASAYISGISVGILIRSPAFWPYVLCGVLAISSKYVLRVKNRHLWNPSNFGICVMLFLAADYVAPLSIQWGNSLLPMIVIWMLGSIIIWRLKRFHISAVYVACFILLAFIRSWITRSPWQSELSPITGPEYQLFIFFMITDPKTTVRSRTGQCVVVAFVALAEMVFRLHQVVFAPLYALFIVGPTAMLVELWFESRRAARIQRIDATANSSQAVIG